MSIEQWWPKLDPTTQQLLIDNNGDVVPQELFDQIVAAGGDPADASWSGETGAHGYLLSDAAIDWIEATANDERSDDV